MKLLIYSAVAFCFLCHHHLFHRHAKACGGVGCGVAVQQSFAVAQPCYQQSFAVAAPVFVSPVYAQPVYAAPVAVQARVFAAPTHTRTVIRTRSVTRVGF